MGEKLLRDDFFKNPGLPNTGPYPGFFQYSFDFIVLGHIERRFAVFVLSIVVGFPDQRLHLGQIVVPDSLPKFPAHIGQRVGVQRTVMMTAMMPMMVRVRAAGKCPQCEKSSQHSQCKSETNAYV